MPHDFTESALEAYLDEALAPAAMAEIETALRGNAALAARLMAIHARRDVGFHSLGEIWRRHRVSCPSRRQLGSYLLDVLPATRADYIRFHLEVAGCRLCQANFDDLQRLQRAAGDDPKSRRRKYFQSSAGLLKRS